ncbi:hypothetical protein WN943_019816 [Citrus x changshan-huyou]
MSISRAITCKAVVCWGKGEPWKVEEIQVEPPKATERTRQTLNAKISQLNNAIDNVSSRLRGGNSAPKVPVEIDPEVEATM